jgi:hypothetical protein
MRRAFSASFVLITLTCAGLVVASASSIPKSMNTHGVSSPAGLSDSRADAATLQQKGRYKQDGEACVWDPNDSGPNQCTPQTAGRFKKSGDACTWDPKDKGPDQCTPPKGRWKMSGDRCVWDANDSGPNQCNPRQTRKRE